MPAYILTGAPGAGKTAVLRLLEVIGYAVVEEAATDVIALGIAKGCREPWQDSSFPGKVLALQRQREAAARAAAASGTVFFDRSPACTLVLSRYLGLAPSRELIPQASRALAEGTYDRTAFLIRNQGFVEPTAARRISFQDSLAFERLHERTYLDLGFHLVNVPAGSLTDRVALIQQTIGHQQQ